MVFQLIRLFALSSFCLLIGCAGTSKIDVPVGLPEAELPDVWQAKTSQSLNVSVSEAWLGSFNSPQLTQLVRQSLDRNYGLKQQYHQLEIAAESVRISRAARLPFLDLGFSGSRADNSTEISNQFALQLGASYSLDLWGKLSIGQKQTQLNLAVEQAKFHGAQQSLVAAVVNKVVDTTTANNLLKLFQQRFDSLEQSLDVIQRGYRSGLNEALDVYLSQNALQQERSNIANQKQALFEARSQLNLLLANYPSGLPAEALLFTELTISLPSAAHGNGVPSELVKRRPDIQQAWLAMMAADAGLAIAHKNRFPSLSLSGNVSDGASSVSDVFDGKGIAWGLGVSLLQPLFDGGRLKALESQAKSKLKQLEQLYLEVAFTAIAEVENEIYREISIEERIKAQTLALSNAEAARKLSFEQYQKGLVSYTTVLESQRRAFDAQTSLVQFQAQQIRSRVNLFLALGGEY